MMRKMRQGSSLMKLRWVLSFMWAEFRDVSLRLKGGNRLKELNCWNGRKGLHRKKPLESFRTCRFPLHRRAKALRKAFMANSLYSADFEELRRIVVIAGAENDFVLGNDKQERNIYIGGR